MAYSPKRIFQLIDTELLLKLIKKNGELIIPQAIIEDNDQFFDFLESSEPWPAIDSDLREIHVMANDDGINKLIEFSDAKRIELDESYESCENDSSRAAWFYLNHYGIFQNAFIWDHLVKDHGSEYKLNREESLSLNDFSEAKIGLLKSDIQKFFKGERKAKYCQIDLNENPEMKSLCLSVYFDDYSKSELGFENGKLHKKPRKPAKDMHFLVFLDEKKVALQFKGVKYPKKRDLMKLFVENFLGEEFKEDNFKTIYLHELFDENFSLLQFIPPEDNIDFVRIKSLRFEKEPGTSPQRIILDVMYGKEPQEIYRMMANYNNLSSGIWKITQATIHFQFKNLGQKGSVTTTLTAPNSDDLQDKPLHNKCRKYLTDAGLMA